MEFFTKKNKAELEQFQAQLEAYQSQLETQANTLEQKESHLDQKQNNLLEREEVILAKEKDLFSQEMNLKEKSLKVNIEYTEELKSTFDQHIQSRLDQISLSENSIQERGEQLNQKHQSLLQLEKELLSKQALLQQQEAQAKADYPTLKKKALYELERLGKELNEEREQFNQKENELLTRTVELEKEKNQLRERERQIREAEAARDASYQAEREALDQELLAHKSKVLEEHQALLLKLNKELDEKLLVQSQSRLADLDTQAKAKQDSLEAQIKTEKENLATYIKSEKEALEAYIKVEKGALESSIKSEKSELKSHIKEEKEALNTYTRTERDQLTQDLQKTKTEQQKQLKEDWEQLNQAKYEFEQAEHKFTQDQHTYQRNQERYKLDLQDLENREQTLKEEVARQVSAQQSALNFEKDLLEQEKSFLESSKENLKEEVKRLLGENKANFEAEVSQLKQECELLRGSLTLSRDLLNNFEDLKAKLGGDDPAVVLKKLREYESQLKLLREQLATRPEETLRHTFNQVQQDLDSAKAKYEDVNQKHIQLQKQIHDQRQIQLDKERLEERLQSLEQRHDAVKSDNERLHADLLRLSATYGNKKSREERIESIQVPYFDQKKARNSEREINELEWLDGIEQNCNEYGVKFPRRILDAFHTSLKVAEYSPITVLAGVSGTGKSELPRLYSHFGGINFLSLAVQPNWDSQESMLGFFNSIDNKFDAQPVLRLLAQSQQADSTGYFGLNDTMSIILLDEMNLAHVELYFAEFLSKFELRRGKGKTDLPSLDIKLGAGIEDYQLPLGRNVLWTGTMNQDETTKSLSDKVLDRGIVINFPRPITLNRRVTLNKLGQSSPLLQRKSWNKWLSREISFTDEQIKPFKSFIEEMNGNLSIVGRAMGHRVWQSIEAYMDAYPHVRHAKQTQDEVALKSAMKTAFEDQLVQKVMPKLRGIETRGFAKDDCLDKIRGLIIDQGYGLEEDFDHACKVGYGQFMWSSANYLTKELETDSATDSMSESEEDVSTSSDQEV